MEKFLQDLIARKQAELTELEARNDASTDIAEVRSIGVAIKRVNTEISDAQTELAKLDADEARGAFNPNATLNVVSATQMNEARSENVDPTATLEYRNAFKNYVQTGVDEFPQIEARNEFTVTAEVGKIIPNTILNEFIKAVSERHGQIYAKVRKLAIRGGVEIPISELAAQATWIAEDAVSDRRKAGEINTSISFKYHTLELRIAQSLLSSIVTLDIFEREIVRIMVEAFAKEMDMMILTGSGIGQPLGILRDSRVTNEVVMSEDDFADWTKWREKLFAIVPLSKRGGGEFLFTPATWETYLMSMRDNENRPLAKEAAGIVDGAYAGRFFGRSTDFVEPIAIKDMATAQVGEVVGVFWIPNDYVVNTNLQLAYKRWFDNDKNQYVNKGIVITDGKIADTAGCYIIKKGVSTPTP